jgi:hypothetical protein
VKVNQLGNATDASGVLHPTHQRDDIEEEQCPQTDSSPSSEKSATSNGETEKPIPSPAQTTERRSKADRAESYTASTTATSGKGRK